MLELPVHVSGKGGTMTLRLSVRAEEIATIRESRAKGECRMMLRCGKGWWVNRSREEVLRLVESESEALHGQARKIKELEAYRRGDQSTIERQGCQLVDLRERVDSLCTELKTARDEMERQAALYAEASRHRAEVKDRLEQVGRQCAKWQEDYAELRLWADAVDGLFGKDVTDRVGKMPKEGECST